MSDSDLTICGGLGRDPELRFTQGGMAMVTMGVAVSRRWLDKKTDEWQEKTSWIDVTVFGQLAENVAQSLKKGDRVMVKGRLEQDEWEDRDSGEKRSKLKMVADEIGASLKWATAQVERNVRDKPDSGRTTRRSPKRDEGYGEEPF
jgi:single-strand DNA-binding protein